MSLRLRALLALAWWAGFYVLGLAVVGALLWVPYAQSTWSRQLGPAGLLAGGLGLSVAWALRPRFEPLRKRENEPLRREQAPRLFAFVDDVARKAGTKAPEELYLALEATAYTALERRGWFRRVRTLTLGLPVLAWLSEEELAAVLAHELGHHVGGDVALGPWVYRTRAALGATIGNLEDSMFFLDVPFRAYGSLFLRLTASISREQELAADALSARVAGAAAARRALRTIHERSPLWQAYFNLDVVPFVEWGQRLPMLAGYRLALDVTRPRPAFAKALEALRDDSSSPWDTHPTLEQRLSALPMADGLPSTSRPSLRLLGEDDDTAETLALACTIRVTGEPLHARSWEELGPWLVERFREQLAETPLEREASLEALPRLVREAEALSDALSSGGVRLMSREAKRREALGWLERWATVRLVDQGAVPRFRPGEGLTLVRGDEVIVPSSLVNA